MNTANISAENWRSVYLQTEKILLDGKLEQWKGIKKERTDLVQLAHDQDPRWRQEYDFLASTNHPSFPRVYFHQKRNGSELYIRQYIVGKPLAELFGKLPLEKLQKLVAQILRSLAALHHRGYSHGDLSGTNILVTEEHQPFLIDFEFLSPRHRTVSEVRGTPTAMAPEIFLGLPPTIQTDLYALGANLYALISGHYPFESNHLPTLFRQHLLETPPNPVVGHSEFPPTLGWFILRLLAKEPAERFVDANDALTKLNEILRLKEPLEPAPPSISVKKHQRVIKSYSQEQEAIRFLQKKSKLAVEEEEALAELLLKTGDFNTLEKKISGFQPPLEKLYRGLLLNRQGRYQESLSVFKNDLDQMPNDSRKILGLATACYYTGAHEAAFAAFEQIQGEWKNQPKNLAVLENFKGNLLYSGRQFKESTQTLTKALHYAEKAGTVSTEALTLMNLANVEMSLGEWSQALHHYRQSVELYQGLGARLEKVRAQLNLAGLYRFLGELDKAKGLLEEAELSLKTYPNPQLQAHLILLKVDLAKKRGDYALALKELKEAKKFLLESASALEEGDFRIAQAEIHFALKEDPQAKEALAMTESHAEKSSDSLLGQRATLLQKLISFLEVKPENEGILSTAKVLYQQGDIEFVLDNLQVARLRATAANLPWPASFQQWTGDLVKKIAGQLNPDDQIFFLHQYQPLHDIVPIQSSVSPSSQETPGPLQSILDCVRELTGELNLSGLTEKILDQMLKLTQMERGLVIVKEGDQLILFQTHEMNPEEYKPEGKESLSWSLTRLAIQQGAPLFTADAQTDERFSLTKSVRVLNLRAILVIPFRFQGEVLGTVYLDSRLQKHHYQEAHLPYLSAFADILGLAIRNATRFEKTEQDLLLTQRTLEQTQKALQTKYQYENVIGRSETTQQLLQRVDRVTEIPVTLLMYGESGVGKEVLARAIHYNGPFKNSPFVAANCSAIPESLVESELFGHERGAFTHATQTHLGLFEQADKGTLFLDEIGEMPLPLQAKMLRVLEDGEILSVVGTTTRNLQVIVIAATHRDLKAEIRKGRFREDLYYRLNVAMIQIPPLRERRADIPLLIDYFLERFAKENHNLKKKLDRKVLMVLMAYHWPGNIRELENLIYNLCVFSSHRTIQLEDLKQKPEFSFLFSAATADPTETTPLAFAHLSSAIDQGRFNLSAAKRMFEREEIVRVLSLHRGKVGEAAQHLGIPRPQLSRLLSYHQLQKGKGTSN